MEAIIKLESKYEERNWLKRLKKAGTDEESKTYLLNTASPFNAGYIDAKTKFIDLAGGPMLIEGQFLAEADSKIKSIDYITGFGWTITFS